MSMDTRRTVPDRRFAPQERGIREPLAGTRRAKRGASWPPSRPPICRVVPPRPLCMGSCGSTSNRFSPTHASITTAGCPATSRPSCAPYLNCGVFSEGFTRCHCDACGHDLLVAFSCKSRTVCPSCAGRRMANTAATIVDRVLPDVPVRQYVLSLPYELRRLAAFKPDVLTALGRVFVDAVFASYRRRSARRGIADGQCGAINFVQRFGSMNLNVHFHVVVLDGVFTRSAGAGVQFHAAPPPAREELDAIVRRTQDRAVAWLRRHGHLDERPHEERGQEAQGQTALDACAAIAIGRGQVSTLPNVDALPHDPDDAAPDGPALAVDVEGFNLHAGVRIAAGDDLGRERLCRCWSEAAPVARAPAQVARRASGVPSEVRRSWPGQAPRDVGDGVHGATGRAHRAAEVSPGAIRRCARAAQLVAERRGAAAARACPSLQRSHNSIGGSGRARRHLRRGQRRAIATRGPGDQRGEQPCDRAPRRGANRAACPARWPVAGRRRAPRAERARGSSLGQAHARGAVRCNTEGGLGTLAPALVRRGRAAVPEVPGSTSCARRHHREGARPAHPGSPRCTHSSPSARPRARPSRRAGRRRGAGPEPAHAGAGVDAADPTSRRAGAWPGRARCALEVLK